MQEDPFELSSAEVSEVRKMIHSDPPLAHVVNESKERPPTPVVVKEFIRDKNQIGSHSTKKEEIEHVGTKKKGQIIGNKDKKQDKNLQENKVNNNIKERNNDVVNKEPEQNQKEDKEEIFEAPRIYFPVSNKPSPPKQKTDLNKKQVFKHSPLFTRKPLPVRALRGLFLLSLKTQVNFY